MTDKGTWQVKALLLTEATEVWVEAQQLKHPERSPQEILRLRLHEIASQEIRDATVLNRLAARRGLVVKDRDGE